MSQPEPANDSKEGLKIIGELRQVNAQQAARIEQLEARLGKDSHNSHQPPSSDGLAKRPRPRSLRKPSGKKSGGQVGHPGVSRVMLDEPEVVIAHEPTVCAEMAGGK